MNYLVTARKWRPMLFEDVIGQAHITTTLRNAIASNRLSHAYLFSGPRGVGKTTTARILAKAINCLNPVDHNPDNECEICKEITEGRSLDVFEIDGASNRGIDEIRNLRESVKYVPTRNKYKVYVIDEVHMLTKEAFNALLKTLEEPPRHVVFIFATTENHKVPPTILSRCQRYDFRRIGLEEIIHQLKIIAESENILIDSDALILIAKKGDGSMRDAQSVFDQVVSYCGKDINAKKIIEALNLVDEEIYFKTTDVIKAKDAKSGILLVDEIASRGYDIKEYLSGLNEHLRNLLITITTKSSSLIETSEVYKKRYESEASDFSENDILRLINIITDTENSIKWSQHPRFKLEIAILQMIKLDKSIQITELLDNIDDLKKKLNNTGADTHREIKVEGKVKATPPGMEINTNSISSNNLFQSGTEKQNIKKPSLKYTGFYSKSIPVKEEIPSISPQNQLCFDIKEARQKWCVLINKITQERVSLGSSMNLINIIDISNGFLKLACPNEFYSEMIHKNRNYITELAQAVYGGKLRIETIISDIDIGSNTKSNSPESHNTEDHPIIGALKDKFGAVRIH